MYKILNTKPSCFVHTQVLFENSELSIRMLLKQVDTQIHSNTVQVYGTWLWCELNSNTFHYTMYTVYVS